MQLFAEVAGSYICCAEGAQRWSFPACERAETRYPPREGLAHIQLLPASFRYNQLSILTGSLNAPDFPQHCWLWSSAVEGDAGDKQLLPSLMGWLLLQRNHLWHFPKDMLRVCSPGLVYRFCLVPALAVPE